MPKLKLDASIYTAVAQHYIASPEFQGLDDPLPVRSGFVKGDADFVTLPMIPERARKIADRALHREVGVPLTLETWEKVVEWAAENAPEEGRRHKYWTAIAGFLYRCNVDPDEVSEIVYDGACTASDREARSRADCALRACDAIARGHSMTGIPTLVDEFSIEGIENIESILGANKYGIDELISSLALSSDDNQIDAVLREVAALNDVAKDRALTKIKEKTKVGKTALAKRLKAVSGEKQSQITDICDYLSDASLRQFYSNGADLIRVDRQNYVYNGAKWEEEPDEYTSKRILQITQDYSKNNPGIITNHTDTVRDAYFLTKLKAAERGDPLKRLDMHQPVINAKNAEIWFYKDGSYDVLPHHRDSFQMVQIDVDYDPVAYPKRFKKAVTGIFSSSEDAEEMYRHFMELVGNIIVPRRDFAGFSIWKGGSNCGKSKLLETLIRLVGQSSVLSIKLDSLLDDRDAIGNLVGKLIVVDDDLEQGAIFPDGNIKRISEAKYVTGEKKYQNKFSFYNAAFPLMIGNHWPIIRSADPSIERRALVIPFNRSFTIGLDDNRDLFPTIWSDPQEMSGILNEAIAGYQRLRKRGAFLQPRDCLKAYQEWVSGSAFLPLFLNEICVPNPDGPNQLWSEHIRFYRLWAEARGVKNRLSDKDLKKAYEGLGFKFSVTDGYPTIKGIRAPDPPM